MICEPELYRARRQKGTHIGPVLYADARACIEGPRATWMQWWWGRASSASHIVYKRSLSRPYVSASAPTHELTLQPRVVYVLYRLEYRILFFVLICVIWVTQDKQDSSYFLDYLFQWICIGNMTNVSLFIVGIFIVEFVCLQVSWRSSGSTNEFNAIIICRFPIWKNHCEYSLKSSDSIKLIHY